MKGRSVEVDADPHVAVGYIEGRGALLGRDGLRPPRPVGRHLAVLVGGRFLLLVFPEDGCLVVRAGHAAVGSDKLTVSGGGTVGLDEIPETVPHALVAQGLPCAVKFLQRRGLHELELREHSLGFLLLDEGEVRPPRRQETACSKSNHIHSISSFGQLRTTGTSPLECRHTGPHRPPRSAGHL